MQFNSIRFKASILYSAILALILIVFSTVVYLTVHTILYHDLDQELKIKAEEISNILYAYEQIEHSREHPLGAMLEMLRSQGIGTNQKMVIDDLWRSQLEVLNLKNDFVNILNIRGRAVFISNNLKEDVASLFAKKFPFTLTEMVYKTLSDQQYKLRAVNMPIKFHNTRFIIQVGTSLGPIGRVLHRLLLLMAGTTVILLIITSFMGRFFAENILKPVKEVADLANKITYKDLSTRMKEKKIDVEMKMLVNSFNVMIKRLETSFSHINEFSSHVAHELKTPLAIMRGEIELALDQNRDSKEYKRVLTDNLDEIDRMIKVVKDLLLLAKLDYKPEIFKFEKFNLSPFFHDLYGHSKVLASSKDIEMKLTLPEDNMCINGDKIHLRRLFLNLINNAVQYTPVKGKIDLCVRRRGSKAFIDITDTGEGISQQNLSRVFDKFFRIAKDEHQKEAGSGLGLNIAQSIAKAHKGEITVRSQLGKGTIFTVTIPLA